MRMQKPECLFFTNGLRASQIVFLEMCPNAAFFRRNKKKNSLLKGQFLSNSLQLFGIIGWISELSQMFCVSFGRLNCNSSVLIKILHFILQASEILKPNIKRTITLCLVYFMDSKTNWDSSFTDIVELFG
jgi:hypothetical protein